MHQKGFAPIVFLLAVVAVLVLYLIAQNLGIQPLTNIGLPTTAPVSCSLDAKICPDGTGVGRVGPNCEFSPCPTSQAVDTSNWKTYTNNSGSFSLKYPNSAAITEENNLVILKDKDSFIRIVFAKPNEGGFGGGCDEQHSKTVYFAGETREICADENSINLLYATNPYNNLEFSINAEFTTSNKNIFTQILSTFEFLE